MLGNSWVTAQLAASQESLSSMELVLAAVYCNIDKKSDFIPREESIPVVVSDVRTLRFSQ
jgi:hypothetical protein